MGQTVSKCPSRSTGLPEAPSEAPPAKFRLQVIAGCFLRIESYLAAKALKCFSQECAHAVDSSFVVAGRFNLYHLPQQRQHFAFMLLAESKVGESGLAGRLWWSYWNDKW